jgi:glycosyltransferase involved in cell wall biosynthesis
MRKLLVIAGPLSGYSFELYRAVRAAWSCAVDIVHEPMPQTSGFAHEGGGFDDFRTLDWTKATTLEIFRFLRESKPDAVVVQGTRPVQATAVAFAILPRRVPVLYASDANIGSLVEERGKLLPRLASYGALFARVDVALSLGLTNELAHRLLGAKRIEPLPVYAIDFAALDQARLRAVVPGQDSRARVAIVARLVGAKNLISAFEALSSDPTIREQVRVSMVGDGPLRDELRALADARGLSCEWLGALPRAEVGSVIGHSDVLLLPSTYEPWGIVVCEALGLGIPVIASPAVGAAVSLAGHSRGVLLSAGSTVADLADAMRRFFVVREELGAAAANSAPLVRERYSLPNVATRFAALLTELTERRA